MFIVKPKLVPLQKHLDLFQNSTYVLSCNLIAGSRPVFFDWLKDDLKLNSSEHVRVDNSATFSLLTFTDLQSINSGHYVCEARNIHGTDSTSAQLFVKGFKYYYFFKYYFINIYNDGDDDYHHKRIIKQLKNRIIIFVCLSSLVG